MTRSKRGVRVLIIDSGVDPGHALLHGRSVRSWAAVGPDAAPRIEPPGFRAALAPLA